MAIFPDFSRISVLAPSHHGLILGKSRKPSAYQAPGETMLLLDAFGQLQKWSLSCPSCTQNPSKNMEILWDFLSPSFRRTVGGKWISQVSYKIEQVPIKIHKGHWNNMQDVHGFGSEIKHDKTWGTIGPANWLFLVPYPHCGYILIQKQTEIQLNGILDLRLEQPSMFFAPLFALYPPPCTWSVPAFC